MRVCGLAKHAKSKIVYKYGRCDDEDDEDLQKREFHFQSQMKIVKETRHTIALYEIGSMKLLKICANVWALIFARPTEFGSLFMQ